jgi:peptidoglycan/LPS O-acetylase OafA/YrhL
MRTIAVGLVVFQHGTARFHNSNQPAGLHWFLTSSWGDGVAIFFVISGFLITTLLLREYDRYGSISLGRFYLRRTLRIFPPLYLYLIVMWVFAMAYSLGIPASTFISSFFFFRNYSTAPTSWLTDHTWSLAVEEQFYLLWPPLLALMLSRGRERGRRYAVIFAAVLIAVSPLLRIAQKLYGPAALAHRESYLLHTRLDGLMCGCLLALAIGTTPFEAIYAKVAKIWWVFPIYFLAVHGYLASHLGSQYLFLIGLSIDSIVIALFLAWAIRNADGPVGRFLNWRPMAYLGVLSYSIYIWQSFFLHELNPTVTGHYPWNLLGIMAAALLSYYAIERPSLRLRDRFLGKDPRIPLDSFLNVSHRH